MPSLAGCFSPLLDKKVLEELGFSTTLTPRLAALPDDSLLLAEEDQWATTLARMALEAVANRARSLIWHEEGYPGQWAPLLSPQAEVVGACLKKAAANWGAWQLAQGHKGNPVVKRMLSRSMLNQAAVLHTFHLLEQANFEVVPPAVKAML
eukprot:5694058-Lingulodinium_polyedra.AAC.1